MKGASGLLIVGFCLGWASSQFLNNQPFPTYSLENMPDTEFSCRDKILGGYYADAETQCQMFHICVKVSGVGVQDFRFLCPNGTAFDQDHQICADWEDVDCDATTLYYSSDNFDLYRIGSGLESKAVKYGEEEDTFALQRAETGDARLNREHQVQKVNQQKEATYRYSNKNNYQQQKKPVANNDKEIFKSSSSSNFFNNRNSGKEPEDDEEYDTANTNANQDNDNFQKRKLVRKQQRRPSVAQNTENYPQQETRTSRPQRPTGFTNNFAGSSFVPTTAKPTASPESNNNNNNNYNNNQQRRHRIRVNAQNNARQQEQTQPQNNAAETPSYVPSTPAPFRNTQQYSNINRQAPANNGQYKQTTQPPKTTSQQATENYPSNFPQKKATYSQPKQPENYPTTLPATNTQYDVTKIKQTQKTEYPSTVPVINTQYNTNYDVAKTKQTENYPTTNTQFNKQTTAFKQTDNYPTTFAPKPFQNNNNNNNNNNAKTTQYNNNFPTTFAPRTNAAYTQIAQQTTQYKQQNTQAFNNQNTQAFNNQNTQYTQPQTTQYNNAQNTYNQYDNTRQTNTQTTFNQQNTTPRTSPYTQYTPTVPKVTTPFQPSTTPVSRSNRFDETQYDDGSYNSKYDNYDNSDRRDDELIKTAHSTNIASSRNEFVKNNKNAQAPSTQKPYYESPRPFSVSPATPKTTQALKTNTNVPQKPVESSKKEEPAKKKEKNVSYDYAYYDSNSGSELEYDINTEIEKSDKTKKQ